MSIVVGSGRLPIGPVYFAVQDDRLLALALTDGPSVLARLKLPDDTRVTPGDPLGLAARIERYGQGALDAFDDVPLAPRGTPFQTRVWALLRAIPAGQTRSYLDLARALGTPTATRAVGTANGANPISLIVPCHRVIRSDGALGGYAYGLPKKEWLLTHEGAAKNWSLPGLGPQ